MRTRSGPGDASAWLRSRSRSDLSRSRICLGPRQAKSRNTGSQRCSRSIAFSAHENRDGRALRALGRPDACLRLAPSQFDRRRVKGYWLELIHLAHVFAAAMRVTMAFALLLLGLVGHECLGGEHEAGHARGILECGA